MALQHSYARCRLYRYSIIADALIMPYAQLIAIDYRHTIEIDAYRGRPDEHIFIFISAVTKFIWLLLLVFSKRMYLLLDALYFKRARLFAV